METNSSNSSSSANRPTRQSNNSSSEKPIEEDIFVNHGIFILRKLVFFMNPIESDFKYSVLSYQSMIRTSFSVCC